MRVTSFVLMIVAILMAACSTTPRHSPAPVVRSSPEPAAGAAGEAVTVPPPTQGVEVSAYEPSVSLPLKPESSSQDGQAVVALLASAEQQQKAGDTSAAVGTVERALRIEPRNAHLWNRLANLRFDQKRYAMVSDLAAKSNSLAAGDSTLKRQNWFLIARAKRAQGDVAGASEAERMARKDW